jgi:rod shape-determining protein MreD
MSVGLLFGSLPGAIFGFGVGLILDLLLIQTLGQYALIYLAVGYGAGRLMELRAPSGRLVLLPLGAAATATVTLGFGLLQVLLGGGANLNVVVLRQTALAVLWGALLAIPVDAMVRKIVVVRSKARPDSTRSGRSHAYATGGLSPLTPGRKK